MRLLVILPILSLLFAFIACDSNNSSASGADERLESASDSSEQVNPLDSLNQAIVDRPSDPEVYLQRARHFWRSEDPTKALDDLNRAVQLDSTNAAVLFERGEYFWNLQQFDLARADYERCVAADPTSTDCRLKLGAMHIHLKNYTDAIQHINDALRQNEQLPFAYYMKGRIYKETGDTLLAASSYQTAIETDPDYYDAYIEAGLLYAAAKSDLALEYYRTAMELQPKSVEALYNTAMYYQSTGLRDTSRFSTALELYDRILDLDPGNATAPYNKGFIYLEYLQDYASAVEQFTQAAEIYPGYFQAYYNRGLANESLGNKEEALQDYNRCLGLAPDFTPAALAKSRVLGE